MADPKMLANEQSQPSIENPHVHVWFDSITKLWGLTMNFGMGLPWVTKYFNQPFHAVESPRPEFSTEDDARAAADLIKEAVLEVAFGADREDPSNAISKLTEGDNGNE